MKECFFRHRGNAEVVRQDLLRELSIDVSLRTVERAVAPFRRLLTAEAKATVRFETAPGHQLQIDFGEPVVDVTPRRRPLRRPLQQVFLLGERGGLRGPARQRRDFLFRQELPPPVLGWPFERREGRADPDSLQVGITPGSPRRLLGRDDHAERSGRGGYMHGQRTPSPRSKHSPARISSPLSPGESSRTARRGNPRPTLPALRSTLSSTLPSNRPRMAAGIGPAGRTLQARVRPVALECGCLDSRPPAAPPSHGSITASENKP